MTSRSTINERAPLIRRSTDSRRPSTATQIKDDHVDSSWGSEFRLLTQYSVPLIATYLLQYSFTVTTTVVAGRLSADNLAAASIGMTTMNVIGFATFEGMATALDTLCAQAYGSGRVTGVGLYVQRMLFLMTMTMIPIGLCWLFSPMLLPLVVKQNDLAVMAGRFLQVSLVGLPGYAFFEAGKRFLQAQGDFQTNLIILVICTPVNGLLSWLLAIKLDMGLDGAALGQALANNLRPLLLLLYVSSGWGKWSRQCWGGWSRSALQDLGPMIRLSVAGTALNLAEWVAFEILNLSASYISVHHLAAQMILNTISVIMWHIPFAVSVAVGTRIGYLIGAAQLQTARRVTILYSVVFAAIGVLDALFMFFLRNPLSAIFSRDPDVISIATNSMLVICIFHIIDAASSGCAGVLRGLAKQSTAAWVVFIINYTFAVPLALWLELGSPDLKLDGLWLGFGAGMGVVVLVECGYLKWIRWQDCIDKVQEREG